MVLLLYKEKLDEVKIVCNLTRPLLVKERGKLNKN